MKLDRNSVKSDLPGRSVCSPVAADLAAAEPLPRSHIHETLLRQQTALVRFGELALRSDDIDEILTEACRLIGDALATDLAKVMELQDDGETLLVRAGVGWNDGVVGHLSLNCTNTSEGYALKTGEPMISPDISQETRFTYPPFLTDHGVRAVANVVILGSHFQRPYGILQIDSRQPRPFTTDDVTFLRSYANLIAASINRLNVNQALREEEERLRFALHAGKLGSWDINPMTGKTSSSVRTLEIFGHASSPSTWNFGALLDHVLPEDQARVISTFRTATDTGANWKFECRIRRKTNGEIRWIEAEGQARQGHGHPPSMHLVGVVADITKRKVAEDALHRVNQRLERKVEERTLMLTGANARLLAEADERQHLEVACRQTNKMEAVGQLTAGLARDYGNLLTSISGSLDLIRSRSQQGRTGELARYIETAQAAASRAANLTRRLLTFSRRQVLHPRRTDMNRMIEDMNAALRSSIPPAIRIATDLAPDLWPAFCDSSQLESALLNIVNNACEAMAGGGSLEIRTTNAVLGDRRQVDRRAPPDQLLQLSAPPGDYVCLTVVDTGTGMAPDVLARAFDPFFTTKPFGSGSGLGLSMTHGFVQQSGGRLHVRSAPAKGTVVTINLPKFSTQDESVAHPRPADMAADQSRVVLLAEYEPAVRMVIADTLGDAGYTVLEAGDGAAGLSFAESGNQIDLLITELNLFGPVSGQDLALAARRHRPQLKVLFLTSYAEGSGTGPAVLDPGVEVMTKPLAMEPFTQQVRTMMG